MALPGKKGPGKPAGTAGKQTPPPAEMTLEKLGAGIKKVIGEIANLNEAIDKLTAAQEAMQETLEALASGTDAGTDTNDEEVLTAEQVRRMSRKELIDVVNTYELKIDPDDYPKIGDFRTALISLMDDGGEEGSGEEGSGEEGSGDW